MSATKKSGIILVSLGYQLYGSCAVNLAMSLKSHDPSVKICLVHDVDSISHLTAEEKKLFDIMLLAEPADYTIGTTKQYQRMKLCVNKYTPFDNTLYIDVDTLWFPGKSVLELMESLKEFNFFIGHNGTYDPVTKQKTNVNYTYWENPAAIAAYFKLQNTLPQTISGVFYFTKNKWTEKVFARGLEVYNDKLAPCIKWANGKPDEYCFNVALSEAGYTQRNCHFVYFDKTNGILDRQVIYDNFWGIAAGGNKLSLELTSLYNELVNLFVEQFGFITKRLHVDKAKVIKERNTF
jgi:hypothetical protein